MQVSALDIGVRMKKWRVYNPFANGVIASFTNRINPGRISNTYKNCLSARNGRNISLIKQIFLYIYCFLYCTQKYIQVIYMQSELMISTQFTLPWEMYTNVLHNMYRLSAILLISNQKKLPCTNAFFLALHKT